MVKLENERGIVIIGAGAGKLAYVVASSCDRVNRFSQSFADELRELENITRQTAFTINKLSDSLNDPYFYVDESLNASSLRRLKELMFIPRKIQLSTIYNKKPTKTTIRNNLKQRIRLNEKATV